MAFRKILIANRGEIARRIARTCRKRGLSVVGVYSEADRDWPFVQEADEAVEIGPPPVAQSYLNMDSILEAARRTSAEAIHPGYGFLSENAAFARKVKEAGLIFIGPRPDVIEAMGDKVNARRMMEQAGVPVVPGTLEGVSSLEEAVDQGERIGYPLMLKARAGGGGIGMQVCRSREELSRSFSSAQGRAKAFFGDGTLFLEKYIERPRHVEVQVAADDKGNVIHLFERECSIQRRNQKIVEESLSPSIHSETRKHLVEAAVRAARSVGYTGVGTVEFLVDAEERFYFLEMNTRLQVEHPVTEMITGLDLVAMQLDIAEGKELLLPQEEIQAEGHAIEYRICAEDPKTFLPSPGSVNLFQPPAGPGIRVDAGIMSGNSVTPFYDSLIAKLVVSGSNRKEALARSRRALSAFRIEGIQTNLFLHRRIVDDSRFVQGKYDTHFLESFDFRR